MIKFLNFLNEQMKDKETIIPIMKMVFSQMDLLKMVGELDIDCEYVKLNRKDLWYGWADVTFNNITKIDVDSNQFFHIFEFLIKSGQYSTIRTIPQKLNVEFNINSLKKCLDVFQIEFFGKIIHEFNIVTFYNIMNEMFSLVDNGFKIHSQDVLVTCLTSKIRNFPSKFYVDSNEDLISIAILKLFYGNNVNDIDVVFTNIDSDLIKSYYNIDNFYGGYLSTEEMISFLYNNPDLNVFDECEINKSFDINNKSFYSLKKPNFHKWVDLMKRNDNLKNLIKYNITNMNKTLELPIIEDYLNDELDWDSYLYVLNEFYDKSCNIAINSNLIRLSKINPVEIITDTILKFTENGIEFNSNLNILKHLNSYEKEDIFKKILEMDDLKNNERFVLNNLVKMKKIFLANESHFKNESYKKRFKKELLRGMI